MNLKQLKIRELGLLNTHRDRLEEYGVAYKAIKEMCEEYSGDYLSEDMLVSDMAKRYIIHEDKMYEFTKNEDHRLHIKAASELIKTQCLSFKKTLELVPRRKISFEEAKVILKNNRYYNKIRPATLKKVIAYLHDEGG